MHITCKCLNVSIKTRGNQLGSFNENSAEHSNEFEKNDEFFQENLATATELEGISKEQPGLVESRRAGSWIVNRCLNCSVYTHAVHREQGAALVLINTDTVMSIDEIEKLKASPNYSSIFRIVVDHNINDNSDFSQTLTKYSVSQLPNESLLALANLQQQLEQVVHKKVAEIDDKIRNFTAEQYQLLEQFREQAHTELSILTNIICARQKTTLESSSKAHSSTVPLIQNQFLKKSYNNTPQKIINDSDYSKTNTIVSLVSDVSMTGENITRHEHSPNKHLAHKDLNESPVKPTTKTLCGSYDTEALFPLEGMDDTSIHLDHPQHLSEDESDTDGQEEGIHIPRGVRGGHPTLAKSLPVSVPNFPSYVRRSMQDQDDDQLPKDSFDPHNIRASIKALAKSVHGDTVFGDLPRPRFSTQI